MSTESKSFNTRIKQKTDTASNWNSSNVTPLNGEIIIYSDSSDPKIKVGDGSTTVKNLPFVNSTANSHAAAKGSATTGLNKITSNSEGHVTSASAVTKSDLTGLGVEDASNKVTSVSSSSTNTQYPSAKCLYDGLATKQDSLPAITNDRYLHTNASTGALEWSVVSGGGGGTWGSITGTLSNQTDLQFALDAKQDAVSEYTATEIETLWSSL